MSDLPNGLVGDNPLDRDKLYMVSRFNAARVAQAALFPIQQQESPEELVMGVGVLFAAVCLRAGIDPSDLFEAGKRVLTVPFDGDKMGSDSLQSLKDFVGLRILAKEVTIG